MFQNILHTEDLSGWILATNVVNGVLVKRGLSAKFPRNSRIFKGHSEGGVTPVHILLHECRLAVVRISFGVQCCRYFRKIWINGLNECCGLVVRNLHFCWPLENYRNTWGSVEKSVTFQRY
ncbi:Hypothetical protein DIP1296A [Corynebacterium diphtheriae]|uniref:Uncharacterized protein n=1 Tax=Corynebacterium diphtheriae (strain ATCC 700971 / NCTC 13129 / Biotype gravis) TaxID=257309 RepID=Q6NH49_CORDI|nr:Hypothetical protein DIP1296A [Corynebacterium diphtheriae]